MNIQARIERIKSLDDKYNRHEFIQLSPEGLIDDVRILIEELKEALKVTSQYKTEAMLLRKELLKKNEPEPVKILLPHQ